MSNTLLTHSKKKYIWVVSSLSLWWLTCIFLNYQNGHGRWQEASEQTYSSGTFIIHILAAFRYCQYFSAGICFWKSSDRFILPETMQALWIPVVVSACAFFLVPWGSLNLKGSSWQGPTVFLVPSAFPLQRFKEQLSYSLSSCCFLSMDPKSTRSVLLGEEDPTKFPHDLLLFLLLCDGQNLTRALLFAWIQWLSSMEDVSEELV